MPLAYRLLWLLALPFVAARLWWRGRREPGYRVEMAQRLGRYRDRDAPTGVVWLHAVSVGETRAAAPLVERLLAERPGTPILLTGTTATGRDTARALFGTRVHYAWLPWDMPVAVRRFLDHWRPRAGIVLETEWWPTLLAEADGRGIPLALLNARLSERSAARYARAASMVGEMLRRFDVVGAQGDADATRLAALGARHVSVTGNLKFDVAVPEAMRARGVALRAAIGVDRPVWLAASTRDGEEALLLDAMTRRPPPDGSVLLLVPRHPQRFDAVADLVTARGFRVARRSRNEPVTPDTRVLLGDTMGEMLAYCAAADLAFVGGSLLPFGGQNVIEPLALGVPALVGTHTHNFAEITERAIASGAVFRVADADALLARVATLLAEPATRAVMATAAATFVAEHRGALDRSWALLEPLIPR